MSTGCTVVTVSFHIRPDDPCELYCINVYIPLLDDVIINDISHRFGPHQRQPFALAGLIPAQLGRTVTLTQVKVAANKTM